MTQGSGFGFRLYLVVSEEFCAGRDFITVTTEAVRGGVDLVQLREKTSGTSVFLKKALRLQDALIPFNVPLIINDNLEVARQMNAYGIHVGNSDLPPTMVRATWPECQCLGYSIEYREQLNTTETEASDYLGISPVFKSITKTDTVVEWGLEGVREIRSLTSKPLVAIGNMNATNACDLIKAGADCIAVVSAICQADDPQKAAYEIRNQIEKAL